MAFLPYLPESIISRADDYEVVYNMHLQWFGYYLVGVFLKHDNDLNIEEWNYSHVPGSDLIKMAK